MFFLSVCVAEDPANRTREEKKRFRSRQTASKQGTNHSDSYSRRIDLPRSNAVATALSGAEERGVDGPSLDRFLFFTTSANIVLIFQSDFGSHRLACSAHTVRDDSCRAGNAAEIFQNVEVESFRSQQCHRRSRLHSKRCLRVVKPLLTHFSSLGSLFLDEIPAWPFFGKPFFGTRQYCREARTFAYVPF